MPWFKLSPEPILAIKSAISFLGVLLLCWEYYLQRCGDGTNLSRLRGRFLLVLALASGFCWWNLGSFHFPSYIHRWDAFHYYIGAKYYSELGYTRLYECSAAADIEVGLAKTVLTRRIRELRNNEIVPVRDRLGNLQLCRSYFSPARWQEFCADISWFRKEFSTKRWEQVHLDHGYNATPVWTLSASLLANLGPASDRLILVLCSIDSLLLIAMWGAVFWAFGWKTASVCLIFWGTNFPGRFWWNGGAFLRFDWLFCLIAGICFLKKNRPVLAGFLLACSAMLRVFPACVLAILAASWITAMLCKRPILVSQSQRRLIKGVLGAVMLFLVLPVILAGHASDWSSFVAKIETQLETPLTNSMGLKRLLSYRHDLRAKKTVEKQDLDPFQEWKVQQQTTFEKRRRVYALLVSILLLLLLISSLGQPDWVVAVLGLGLIPILGDLTCYYYSCFLAFGFLRCRQPEIAIALLLLGFVSSIMPRIWSWYDQLFAWMSLLMLLFVLFVIWRLAEEVGFLSRVRKH